MVAEKVCDGSIQEKQLILRRKEALIFTYTRKPLITTWPIYLDFCGAMDYYFFVKFGKYTKSMLMKRSVFDQRLANIAVKLNCSDFKMWMKLQNSKLCSGKWIYWSCVVVEQDYSILRPYLFYFSFGNFFLTIILRILLKFGFFLSVPS